MKNKEKEIDKDEINGRMFREALEAALKAREGSIMAVSYELGLKSRCTAWAKGHFPPYRVMQEMYPKLLAIKKQNS